MPDQSITVTDQATGVEIACRTSQSSNTVRHQTIIPVNGIMQTDRYGYCLWTGPDAGSLLDWSNDMIGSLAANIAAGKMVNTKDRASLIAAISGTVAGGVTSMTVVPCFFHNYNEGLYMIGPGTPIAFAGGDKVAMNGTPNADYFPLRRLDTLGADYVGWYIKGMSMTGSLAIESWAI